MKVDAESKKFLEEVKKGKPRRFAMICKGVKILNLMVYKIGSETKYKNLIKRADGAGQFFGGVVSGKAKNITFELSSEEYDKPPGKDLLLKQFLAEEAGMSFKPVYAIVDTLTSVDDSDTEETTTVDTVEDADETTGADTVAEETTTVAPDDKRESTSKAEKSSNTKSPAETGASKKDKDQKIAAQLSHALDDLRPMFDQVIEMHPNSEDDLIDKMSEIVDQIRQQRFREARQSIGDFGHALQGLYALAAQERDASETSE